MHRIQVQLTAAQERALRKIAKTRGTSLSSLVREGVSLLLERPVDRWQAIRERSFQAVGRYESAETLSTDHDEAFDAGDDH